MFFSYTATYRDKQITRSIFKDFLVIGLLKILVTTYQNSVVFHWYSFNKVLFHFICHFFFICWVSNTTGHIICNKVTRLNWMIFLFWISQFEVGEITPYWLLRLIFISIFTFNLFDVSNHWIHCDSVANRSSSRSLLVILINLIGTWIPAMTPRTAKAISFY